MLMNQTPELLTKALATLTSEETSAIECMLDLTDADGRPNPKLLIKHKFLDPDGTSSYYRYIQSRDAALLALKAYFTTIKILKLDDLDLEELAPGTSHDIPLCSMVLLEGEVPKLRKSKLAAETPEPKYIITDPDVVRCELCQKPKLICARWPTKLQCHTCYRRRRRKEIAASKPKDKHPATHEVLSLTALDVWSKRSPERRAQIATKSYETRRLKKALAAV